MAQNLLGNDILRCHAVFCTQWQQTCLRGGATGCPGLRQSVSQVFGMIKLLDGWHRLWLARMVLMFLGETEGLRQAGRRNERGHRHPIFSEDRLVMPRLAGSLGGATNCSQHLQEA